MTFMQILFLVVAAVTLFSAMMVVSAKRLMHSALWLVMTLLGVAVSFAMLEASFFAIVQVLVYVGAIAILIIFAVMMTRQVMHRDPHRLNRGWWLGALASAGLFGGIVVVLSAWDVFSLPLPQASPAADLMTRFGVALVDAQQYAIPFELASVLLLAALVGAIYAAYDRSKPPHEPPLGQGGQTL
ncbi:MAG TPA: NADH-quinone oxidoreductase subunit J [Anaerolineaceae bacterium]|nr:NADH-quinone oxidoreductase subunit J [Anaerolineaceae bacterium]